MRRLIAVIVALATTLLVVQSTRTTATADPPPVSPLSSFLGFGYHADQEEALYATEEAERQDLIAACMATAGFEYIPAPPDVLVDATTDLSSLPVNPNEAIRNALSATQQQAYSQALSGRSDEEGMTAAELAALDTNANGRVDRTERASMGCLGQAEAAVPGVFAVVGALRTQLQELDDAIQNDVATQLVHSVWLACVNAAGVGGTEDEVADALIGATLNPTLSQATATALTACNTTRDTAMIPIRVAHETTFYLQNQSVITSLAVPATS